MGFTSLLVILQGWTASMNWKKAIYFNKLDDEQRGQISFADWLALVGNSSAFLQVYGILSAEPLLKS